MIHSRPLLPLFDANGQSVLPVLSICNRHRVMRRRRHLAAFMRSLPNVPVRLQHVSVQVVDGNGKLMEFYRLKKFRISKYFPQKFHNNFLLQADLRLLQ